MRSGPGNVERIVVELRDGLCLQANEADYEDGRSLYEGEPRQRLDKSGCGRG